MFLFLNLISQKKVSTQVISLFDIYFETTIQRKLCTSVAFHNMLFLRWFKGIHFSENPHRNMVLDAIHHKPPPFLLNVDFHHIYHIYVFFFSSLSFLQNVLLQQHLSLISWPFVPQFQVWSRSFSWWAIPLL